MAVKQGVYDSPLGRERTLRFLKNQDRALTAAEPLTQKLLGQTLEATEVFGPQPAQPQEPAFGLEPPQVQPFGPQPAPAPAFGLQPPQVLLGPPLPPEPSAGLLGKIPGAEAALGAFGQAVDFITGLPVPSGTAGLPLPTLRDGQLGVNISLPGGGVDISREGVDFTTQRPTVGEVIEGERGLIQPVTRPAFEFAAPSIAEQLVPGAPGIPGREKAVSGVAKTIEVAGPELALPSNLIPLPVVDAAFARLLGKGLQLGNVTLETGARVSRPTLDALSTRASEIAVSEGDTLLGRVARQFQDDAARLVQERPLAGAAEFGPEPIRPPPGQETPLFPELEQRAALTRDLERTFSQEAEFQAAPSVGGRDFVGEDLLRRNLPTTRDVQNWSRRIPPEERAAMAGEVADVRRGIEDFDTVVAREAPRYESNWFTKLDDFLQPLFGRNRELQTKVRNIFVARDVYVGRQASRMRLGAREWIGRHRDTLGLVTGELDPVLGRIVGQQRRGYALAVEVRAGAKIPKRARQHLNDIIEHPDDYIMTPEQRAALDEYDEIFENLVRAEQRHGVDVEELWSAYAPRLITKAPKGQKLEVAVTRLRASFPSTHPWYTKSRAMPDVRQLFAAGYELGDPLGAMEVRLAAGAETIANQRSVKALQVLGDLPSEQVPDALRTRLKDATSAHKTARAQALKTGSVSDRGLVEQASVALDQAKRDMRRASTLVAQRRPQVLGRTVEPDVALEVNKFLQEQGEGALDDIFRVMRTSLINADYGSLMLQNWTTFWRNNPAWLKGAALGARSIADAPYDYIVRNADMIDMGLRYGAIQQPEEFLLRKGGKASQLLGKAPIVRESQNIFEWNVFVAQTERWKGVMRLAKNEEELLDLASVLRKQSGSNFMPGLTRRQAAIMGKTFFAPQFTTAITSSVIEPLRPGLSAVARRESIKTMGLLFGGAASMTVGLNMALNDGRLPNMTDPDKPGFWGVKVGEGFFFPFGPFQPLVVLGARTARVGNDLAHGRTPSKRDLQAVPRFLTNKASIPVRWVLRLAEAMGVSPEELIGPSFGRPEIVREGEGPLGAIRRELGELAPIGPAQAIEGIRQGAPITGLEALGGRTTVITPGQELRSKFREKHGRDYDPGAGDRALVESDPELAPLLAAADQRSIDRGSEFGLELKERNERLAAREQELRLPEIASSILSGNDAAGSEFTAQYEQYMDDRAMAFFIDFFGEERDPENEEQQAYLDWVQLSPNEPRFIDSETQAPDIEAFVMEKDALFAKLRPEVQEALSTRLRALDENVRKVEGDYRRAKEIRSRYFDAVPIQGMNSELYGELRDFWAFVRGVRTQLLVDTGQDLSLEEAIRMLGPARGKSESFISTAISLRPGTALRDRLRNPLRDAILLKNRTLMRRFFPELFTKRLNQLIFGIESGVR